MRLLLFLLALPLLAQNALYLDLSGPWRVHSGDELGNARPDLNDRDWPTVAVPLCHPTGSEDGGPTKAYGSATRYRFPPALILPGWR